MIKKYDVIFAMIFLIDTFNNYMMDSNHAWKN